jgi:hypothetical protein
MFVGVAAAEAFHALARGLPLQPDADGAVGDGVGQVADAGEALRAVDGEVLQRERRADTARHFRPLAVAGVQQSPQPLVLARLRAEDRVRLVEEERGLVGLDLAEDDGLRGRDRPPRPRHEEFEHVEQPRLATPLLGRRDGEVRSLLEGVEDVRVNDPERDSGRLRVRHDHEAADERDDGVEEEGEVGDVGFVWTGTGGLTVALLEPTLGDVPAAHAASLRS